MPGLFFTNLWMLAGLAAVSVPILIHLLLRRKKKRLRFSTIQFFLQRDEQSSQRRKLRHWLLLAMRVLTCTLLVLAFARPYFQAGGPAAAMRQKRQAVFVLDRSLSMQTGVNDATNWRQAKEAVTRLLASLSPNDRAALVSCAARTEVLSEWAPAPAVAKVLAGLDATCGSARLSDGLQQAARLLTLADPKAASVVYVVSDLQRTTAQNLAAAPLPRDVEVKILKVGDLLSPNMAVTDLQLDRTALASAHALVTSFSDEDNRDLKAEMSIDGQVAWTRSFGLVAGESTNLDLNLPSLRPGWHDVAVRLQTPDALALDNVRYGCLFVPTPLRIAAVETRQGRRSFEEDSFFLITALQPGMDSTNVLPTDFSCEKVAPDDLAGRLSNRATGTGCDLVLVPALQNVPSALGTALNRYVRDGGGVLLFLGEGVSANRYNTEFQQLLPAKLGEMEVAVEADGAWRIGEYDPAAAPFAAFAQPHSGDLSLARFTKRFRLEADGSSAILARFDDGLPFLVSRGLGKGRVLLVNSSADASWNDWPKHKTFVPWLHGTAQFLAKSSSHEEMGPVLHPVTGSGSDLPLGTPAAKAEFRVHGPQAKELAMIADETGELRDLSFPVPGIYSLRNKAGAEVLRMAANPPPEESELSSLSTTEFDQQIVRSAPAARAALMAGLFGSASNQRELWRVLLLGVVVLLFVELVVANRTVA